MQLLTAPSYGAATPRSLYPFVSTAGAGAGAGARPGPGPISGENHWKFKTTSFSLETGTPLAETESIPELAPPRSLQQTWKPSEPKGVKVTIGPTTGTGNNNGNQLAAKVSYTPPTDLDELASLKGKTFILTLVETTSSARNNLSNFTFTFAK